MEAITNYATNHLNNMYNRNLKTKYEKQILIDYIEELLKDDRLESLDKTPNINIHYFFYLYILFSI